MQFIDYFFWSTGGINNIGLKYNLEKLQKKERNLFDKNVVWTFWILEICYPFVYVCLSVHALTHVCIYSCVCVYVCVCVCVCVCIFLIIVVRLLILYISVRNFPPKIADGIWVTVNLPKSPGVFSLFRLITRMFYFGLSRNVLRFLPLQAP